MHEVVVKLGGCSTKCHLLPGSHVVILYWDSDQDKRSNQVIQQCVSVQQCARPITAKAHSCGRLCGVLRRVSPLCPVTRMTNWHSLST